MKLFFEDAFSAYDKSSELVRHMIFLTEKYNTAKFIYHASFKSRRVLKSVLGAENLPLANECDATIILQHELRSILNKTVNLTLLTDSVKLFNIVIRNAHNTEKRLMTNI